MARHSETGHHSHKPVNVQASHYYVGLISGTSVDGIDAVVVEIHSESLTLIATYHQPYPQDLRDAILSLAQPGIGEIDRLGQADHSIATCFALAAREVIDKAQLTPRDITAIGSHGQTVRHRPELAQPFTLQIGDPNRIAELTGITTVADFRRRDMAAGGQGAPLVPAFHRAAFDLSDSATAVVNIGGIANITVFNDRGQVQGFDSGPGNTLMDDWSRQHTGHAFDQAGAWAREGTCNETLLERLLDDPYFSRQAPKSTGPEYFSPRWLAEHLAGMTDLEHADVQRTLLELTARSISASLIDEPLAQIAVCGGGAHNTLLMERLTALTAPAQVVTTEALGIHPDWVEAAAFAWLAYRTLNGLPGNEPTATGATGYRVLGAVYCGTS